LSRVSFLITDYLLTGIITQTSRARYYSFYQWALWNIEQTENPKRYGDFAGAFRRREAFMALATLSNNPESSVVGIEAVKPRLAKYTETADVDTNFGVLPSNPLGGYGQYYGGSLYGLGLTLRTEDGIHRAAPGRGQALAESFDQSARVTPYFKQKQFTENVVQLPILMKSAERFSLDSLNQAFAVGERQLLRALFLSWDRSSLSDTDLLRRHTLGLVLNSALGYAKAKFKPPLKSVDHYMVYQPYYYGMLSIDGGPVPYELPPQFKVCHGFWKQFCVHEYITQALEFLLYAVLEALNVDAAGMTTDQIREVLLGTKFNATLVGIFGKAFSPTELLHSLGVSSVPTEDGCLKAQRTIRASSSRSESALLDLADGSPEIAAAISVALLGVLYSKWRGSRGEFSRQIESKAGVNLWAGTILPTLDCWLQPATTWHFALGQLIDTFILDQHDRIMYEKGRLESCWLRRLDGKVIKDQDYSPVFRSSRHFNCVRILHDIGLLAVGADDGISITADGRQMLSRILKANGAHN